MILLCGRGQKQKKSRRATAAVELAVLLPVLIFWSMAGVDFARIVYVQVILQNFARNGALYEFYTKAGYSLPSGWTSLATAVQADEGSGVSVTGSATSPASATNNYVTVTTTATFAPIALPSMHGLPSIPGTITLSQSVSMPYPASAMGSPEVRQSTPQEEIRPMLARKKGRPVRRGMSIVEAAVVYPVTILLLLGSIVRSGSGFTATRNSKRFPVKGLGMRRCTDHSMRPTAVSLTRPVRPF